MPELTEKMIEALRKAARPEGVYAGNGPRQESTVLLRALAERGLAAGGGGISYKATPAGWKWLEEHHLEPAASDKIPAQEWQRLAIAEKQLAAQGLQWCEEAKLYTPEGKLGNWTGWQGPDWKWIGEPLTPKELAALLWEAFEADAWGDIDPFLFRAVANGESKWADMDAMRQALTKVAARLVKKEA